LILIFKKTSKSL